MKLKLIAALLAALLLSGCAEKNELPVAVTESPQPTVSLPEKPQPAPEAQYQEAKVYFDGLLADRAYVKDGMVYISPDTVASFHSIELSTEISEIGFEIHSPTLEMEGSAKGNYMKANHRYLYTPEGYITVGESVYFSADVIERLFGVNVTVFGEPSQVEIKGDGLSLIRGGENYYELNYNSEDFYWLQQIIYSESRDEPLAGMIAVGNVVYNRVESELYPDTVFEVIFEREPTVQFDPIATGGIHEGADERSYIAACLCLEGYNTVGESMFFVNPDRGDPTWVRNNRTFVCTIGNHDFYA